MRIVYLCNIVTEDLAEKRGIYTHSPASTKKVMNFYDCALKANLNIQIITMGYGRSNHPSIVFLGEIKTYLACKIRVCTFLNIRGLSPVFSLFSILYNFLCFNFKNRVDKLLIYNPLPNYILVIILCKILGKKIYLDLEDSSNEYHYGGILGVLKKLIENIILNLSDGIILVNFQQKIPKKITNRLFLPAFFNEKKIIKQTSGKIKVLFSGTMNENTGAVLLIKSILKFEKEFPEISSMFEIYVTGFGPILSKIRQDLKGLKNITVNVTTHISFEQYKSLLTRCHIGLSLKLTNGAYGQTTFPSKTFEYAENGLALISTDIEAVKHCFGHNGAIWLNDEDEISLINAFRKLADHDQISLTAKLGKQNLRTKFSHEQLSPALHNFFEEKN